MDTTTPIPLHCFWRHVKSGQDYWAFAIVTNKTTEQDDQPMVAYQLKGEPHGRTYVRAVPEFLEKFERVVD